MKILILSDAGSIHTIRWVNALCEQGYSIILFSLRKYKSQDYIPTSNLQIFAQNEDAPKTDIRKFLYFKALKKIKALISDFKPDILHAHYASSYGILGALTKFHPFIISVWGSDVYDFPNSSKIHRKILKYNLSKADKILSTSKVMSIQTQKYTAKNVEITPFGIETQKFRRFTNRNTLTFIVGIVKTLEDKYGIDILIKAFAELCDRYPNRKLELRIAGEGSKMTELKKMAENYNIAEKTQFYGKIQHKNVPDFLNELDVFVATSRLDSESFGVAIVEASACELPVIVSNVGGLPEVVDNRKTGIVIPSENSHAVAEALELLMNNPSMRVKMGEAGRKKILSEYNWSDNVSKLCEIYEYTVNMNLK